MVMPVGATSFAQALEMTAEVYRAAGVDERRRQARGRGRRRRLVAAFDTNEGGARDARAGDRARGYVGGEDVAISLDIAASEFGRDGRYTSRPRAPRARPRRDDRSPPRVDRSLSIASIEDPLAEDDRDGLDRFRARRRIADPDHRRRLPHDECRACPDRCTTIARATPC
jgi:enolase